MKSRIIAAAAVSMLVCAAVTWRLLPERRVSRPRSEVSEAEHGIPGAMRALDYWAESRAYPGQSFPKRGYAEAFDYAKRSLGEPAGKSLRSQPWRSLGPHNIGGRTLAVALNPQNPSTVYAGAASGGLWRSFTGGVGAAAWHYVSTGYPILGVSSIAIAPDDTNTMYIGTGEVYAYGNTEGGISVRLTRGSYGIGILKTEDGGATWTKSLDWSYHQERGVWAVKIDPANPSVVWAGTTEGTYKSLDGGQSWNQVHAVIMVTDLVINTAHPDTVLVACGNLGSTGYGLYRTFNGGANWTKIVVPGVVPGVYQGKAQLAICESQPNVVLASIGNGGQGSYATWLVRSLDSGVNWTRVSVADYSLWQGWFSHDVAVNPEDPNEVIAVGVDVWKSTTGGSGLVQKTDWSLWYLGQVLPGDPEGPPNYSHADHHDLIYHPTNRDIIYLANDGGVFRSLDGGETFEGCNGGYQTQQFYAGFACSQTDSNLALGGMQDNATAIYRGNDAWVRVIGGDGGWAGIDAASNNVLYGSYQYLSLLKSTNGGGGWFDVPPPDVGRTGFIAPYVLCGGDDHQVLYSGRSYIHRSLNGGVNWLVTNGGQQLDENPALAMAVSQTDCNVLYVTTAPVVWRSGVFRTTNGGGAFDNVTGSLPDRYYVGLAIDPTDDQTVYVTLSGFGSSHAFKSINGGDTWDDIGAGLPDVPTSAVVVDPFEPAHVYVGNDIGVYCSLDGGGDWFSYSAGLPDAVVAMDLSVSPTNGMLRVSTYGNGVYERPLMSTLVDVPDQEPLASLIRLEQNRPNPFNPATEIRYALSAESEVTLAVYDLAGRKVRTLVDARQPAGDHGARWDGRDERGASLPSGVYVCELKAGRQKETRKMMLVR
jgi:hypothetical protein